MAIFLLFIYSRIYANMAKMLTIYYRCICHKEHNNECVIYTVHHRHECLIGISLIETVSEQTRGKIKTIAR